jgi:hypothetical protein
MTRKNLRLGSPGRFVACANFPLAEPARLRQHEAWVEAASLDSV